MDIYPLKKYAPFILRIGISLVFFWFGFSQLFFPQEWVGFLPSWLDSLPLSQTSFILINGSFELLFGFFLLLGLFTRLSALLLALHLFGIVVSLGYTAIAVRDFGLAIATLSIFFRGDDDFCLHSLLWKK